MVMTNVTKMQKTLERMKNKRMKNTRKTSDEKLSQGMEHKTYCITGV